MPFPFTGGGGGGGGLLAVVEVGNSSISGGSADAAAMTAAFARVILPSTAAGADTDRRTGTAVENSRSSAGDGSLVTGGGLLVVLKAEVDDSLSSESVDLPFAIRTTTGGGRGLAEVLRAADASLSSEKANLLFSPLRTRTTTGGGRSLMAAPVRAVVAVISLALGAEVDASRSLGSVDLPFATRTTTGGGGGLTTVHEAAVDSQSSGSADLPFSFTGHAPLTGGGGFVVTGSFQSIGSTRAVAAVISLLLGAEVNASRSLGSVDLPFATRTTTGGGRNLVAVLGVEVDDSRSLGSADLPFALAGEGGLAARLKAPWGHRRLGAALAEAAGLVAICGAVIVAAAAVKPPTTTSRYDRLAGIVAGGFGNMSAS